MGIKETQVLLAKWDDVLKENERVMARIRPKTIFKAPVPHETDDSGYEVDVRPNKKFL